MLHVSDLGLLDHLAATARRNDAVRRNCAREQVGMPACEEHGPGPAHAEAHRVDAVRIHFVLRLGNLDQRQQEALPVHTVPRVMHQADALGVEAEVLGRRPGAGRLARTARAFAAAVQTQNQPLLGSALALAQPRRGAVGCFDLAAPLGAVLFRPLHQQVHDGFQAALGQRTQLGGLLQQRLTTRQIPLLEPRGRSRLEPTHAQILDGLRIQALRGAQGRVAQPQQDGQRGDGKQVPHQRPSIRPEDRRAARTRE